MFTERIQVLMTRVQRRRLEAEARQTGTSVGALIREAIDTRARRAPPSERRNAAREITSMRAPHVGVDELERLVDEEREEWIARVPPRKRRRSG